jgi:hypothetical protein
VLRGATSRDTISSRGQCARVSRQETFHGCKVARSDRRSDFTRPSVRKRAAWSLAANTTKRCNGAIDAPLGWAVGCAEESRPVFLPRAPAGRPSTCTFRSVSPVRADEAIAVTARITGMRRLGKAPRPPKVAKRPKTRGKP